MRPTSYIKWVHSHQTQLDRSCQQRDRQDYTF